MRIASKPFRYEITRAGVLVSRFSTVPFEAMARGVPFIYHNPHGERVPTFTDPQGAFPVTTSAEELADALRALPDWKVRYRDRSEKFFGLRSTSIRSDRPRCVRPTSSAIVCADQASGRRRAGNRGPDGRGAESFADSVVRRVSSVLIAPSAGS